VVSLRVGERDLTVPRGARHDLCPVCALEHWLRIRVLLARIVPTAIGSPGRTNRDLPKPSFGRGLLVGAGHTALRVGEPLVQNGKMGRQAVVALYVLMLVAVVVSVDVLFFRNRFWERLMVNVGIVLVFTAFYLRFLKRL
jgi:hypothetical protein